MDRSDIGIRKISILGLTFLFLIVLSGMLFSAFLIHKGYTVIGTIFAGGVIIAIASLFLSKVSNKRE